MDNINLKDHRKINKQIKIFHISKQSPGMIFWTNNGLTILKNIKKLIRQQLKKYKYIEIKSSFLSKKEIWNKSGHLKNYKNSMYFTSSKKNKLCIKPMNCLGHIEIYKKDLRSYKELPLRISEFGICHRKEKSGSLLGLIRTRSFTQDDGHIFCTNKQIEKEVLKCIKITKKIYSIFNFKKINILISTKPSKYIGKNEEWTKNENILINILKKNNINFKINTGEGAFYGPKIEFNLTDILDRKWQCGTIQLDFNTSKNLKIYYINKKNIKKKVTIIHRAILGSLERFIAILIEQNNGWLPIWLTPIQIAVLNISKKNKEYSKKILKKLNKYNFIRSIGDFENKKINFKIRQYTLQKIPYMVVCGDKEVYLNKINLRNTFKKTNTQTNLNYIIKLIKKKTKKIFKGENY